MMALTKYIKKRDFKKTPEPKGKKSKQSKNLTFVVQRHDASHLHFDFRLELDGVLKSWAVPKGPSLNPGDKRLAVQVEDHPLSYGKFEGVIPKGNYGAGTVEIWDNGTYAPESDTNGTATSTLRKGLKSGSLKITLHGKKLKGSFALVRLKDGKEKNWLLIKHRDEFATNGKGSPSTKKIQTPVTSVRSPRAKERKFKDFIKPMLATLTDEPFDNPDWLFEVKWDGYRAIAEMNKGEAKFYSRNGLSFHELYPEVAAELKKIKKDCIIDGEVVVLDEHGKPSFQKLQQFGMKRDFPILYYVFDCLSYNGKDITDKPLVERKKILKKLLPKSNILKYSEHIPADGIRFYKESKKLNLEGIMAKRADSVYEIGRRTTNWLKVKNHNTQEAIIAGYTAPRASRKYFGSLVLGIYQKGKLKYIGHTGTGYMEKTLKDVYEQLQPYTTESSPFDTKVPLNAAVTWVKPVLVCNVKYSELTHDGILRHPVFMGLRIDKKANEVDQLETNMKTATKKKPARKLAKKTSRKTSDEKGKTIKANGHEVPVTNTQKIFWPDESYTKGDVIDYYNTISSYILPHLKDRPQSLKRNPNGIKDKGFFHKDAGEAAPSWVEHIEVRSDSTQKIVNYILCNNKATLLYLANLGCIELNPWNSRIKNPDHPDYLIMDIDPSDNNTFKEVVDVAVVIKEVLDKAGASCYCKTSGATGIHIYVPLHAAYAYEQARHFAELVAALTAEQIPKLATVERSLDKRKGRIYVDYLQNSRGQTLSSVYSIRPVPGATVSTPIEWKELTHELDPKNFTIKTIHKRLDKLGDIFGGVLKDKNNLVKCVKALEGT
ncbi:MAG TPA: DNA ligase D [Chryseolinea sp.]|nr:DNA ligase D [Chryseolinea sp.]